MANIAPHLWLMAPQYIAVEGEVTIEGDYIRVVATFDWTSFLPSMSPQILDHIWVALPRETYNAADTGIDFIGGNEAFGYGTYIWGYNGVWGEEEGYDPSVGYIGHLTINGLDHVMNLIRGDCYDFLTIQDFFPSGVHASGDMDLKWKRQAGLLGLGVPTEVGSSNASPIARAGGVVRTGKRDPKGRRR